MTLAKMIKTLLAEREPEPICDACIAKQLKRKSVSMISVITGAFSLTNDFARAPAICPVCGAQATVIKSGGTE